MEQNAAQARPRQRQQQQQQQQELQENQQESQAKLPRAMDSTTARSVVLIPRMKPSSASF
jgi:hypothetical protein